MKKARKASYMFVRLRRKRRTDKSEFEKESNNMIIPKEFEKYQEFPEDCPRYDKNNPDYRCSVDCDKTNYRKNKAKEEVGKGSKSIYEIFNLVTLFLCEMGIESRCIIIDGLDILKTINYEHIRCLYNLNQPSDIIWMRFTTDGYLGVVASSNDINFEYGTTSGKIIRSVGKQWDEKKIIIVPLPGIKGRQERLLVEKMIGNYLRDKKVSIIDLYSHNLGE